MREGCKSIYDACMHDIVVCFIYEFMKDSLEALKIDATSWFPPFFSACIGDLIQVLWMNLNAKIILLLTPFKAIELLACSQMFYSSNLLAELLYLILNSRILNVKKFIRVRT